MNSCECGARNAECGVKDKILVPGPLRLVSRHSRGFTLLEVLLSMAILAVIMTVIYASFSTAGNNVDQAERARDETDMARTLIARLSADIANAYVKAPNTIIQGKKVEILGELSKNDKPIRHDGITLPTLTNWPRPNSKETELWEVEYSFKEKPDGTGYMLLRREKRDLSKDPPLEGGVEYEITDRVQSLMFRYMDGTNTWTDNGWDRRTTLPKAVEIVLTLDSGKVYMTRVDVGNS